MKHISLALFVGVLSFSLTACGGGGSTPNKETVIPSSPPGGGGGGDDPVTPVPGDDWRSKEYNDSVYLDVVKAWKAYDEGITGKGVLVGVVDSSFRDRSDNNYSVKSVFEPDLDAFQQLPEADDGFHGTAVSSIIAGARDDVGNHGVAYEAEILAVNLYSDESVVKTQFTEDNYIGGGMARAWAYMIENDVSVINVSRGGNGHYTYAETVANYISLPEHASDGLFPLFVFSAGNSGNAEPSGLSKMILNEAPDHVIIVGGVNENLESIFDKAGSTKNDFIVTIATGVLVADNEDEFTLSSGTSFSAPQVSGAAALALQMWPEMTTAEVKKLILSTATDLGETGVDEVFGHGLLNIEEMFTPQGVVNMPASAGRTVSANLSSTVIPSVFGRPKGSMTTVGFDSFNRDFEYDLSISYTQLPTQSFVGSFFDGVDQHVVLAYGAAATFNRYSQETLPSSFLNEKERSEIDDVYTSSLYLNFGNEMQLDIHLGHAGNQDIPTSRLTQAVSSSFNSLLSQADYAFAVKTGDFEVKAQMGSHDHQVFNVASQSSSAHISVAYNVGPFKAGLGITSEEGSVFGYASNSTGSLGSGLKMVSLSFGGDFNINQIWGFHFKATGYGARILRGNNSVFGNGGNAILSEAKASLVGRSLFSSKDSFVLSVSQPLRSEHSNFEFLSMTRSAEGYGFKDELTSISFTPDRREINIGSSYNFTAGSFSLGIHSIYRHNSDHMKGHDYEAGLIGRVRF